MLHEIYLPFEVKLLLDHFANVKQKGKCVKNDKHLNYYTASINGKPIKGRKQPRQIEKDERFWTAACMMTIYHKSTSPHGKTELKVLLTKAYGPTPPIDNIKNWDECLDGTLHLFFEVNLPSPIVYKTWLRNNLKTRQFIPYILASAYNKVNLEGPTNVDAIILNSDTGFAVIIEAKVLSDISCDIKYDTMRNQIARNIDVMLEKNEKLCWPLDKREPDKTLFLLLTPELYRNNPRSRFYGYKFNDYKNNPASLADDLPHRVNTKNAYWQKLSSRLGWLTWEDFKQVNKNCCPWLP